MVKEILSAECKNGLTNEVEVMGLNVSIKIDDNLGEAGNVWSAVQELGHFVMKSGVDLKGKTIVELGSGTGVFAIACAMYGAHVTSTDAPWVLDLIRYNATLQSNVSKIVAADGQIEVKQFLWGNESDLPVANTPDIVVACECVYHLTNGGLHEIFGLNIAPTGSILLQSISALCGEKTTLFVANRIRSTDGAVENAFLTELREHFVLDGTVDGVTLTADKILKPGELLLISARKKS